MIQSTQLLRQQAPPCPCRQQTVSHHPPGVLLPRSTSVRRSPKLRAIKDEERPEAPPQNFESLAKDALKQLNSEDMTVASVMGAANFERLGQAIGQDKLERISSILDPILKNRRAVTIISAVVDVALIIAGIKLFQAGTSPHE